MIIAPDDDGQRVDRWLKKHFPHLGFGAVQKLLRTGQIRMDGKRLKGDSRLISGAELRLPPNIDAPSVAGDGDDGKKQGDGRPKTPPALSAADIKFIQDLVIYSDGQMVAIDKPSGLAVQGGSKIKRHVDGLLDGLIGESGIRPRLVHRLDRDTSGVLLLARSAESARKLGDMFSGHEMQKTYYAITCGVPKNAQGRIDAPLSKGTTGADVEKMMVDFDHGKPAITDYRVIAQSDDGLHALVAFMPQSGRMHQIRVHAAYVNAPLRGDVKYGGARDSRLFLHAKSLEFIHPKTGKRLNIGAELPQVFENIRKKLNIPFL